MPVRAGRLLLVAGATIAFGALATVNTASALLGRYGVAMDGGFRSAEQMALAADAQLTDDAPPATIDRARRQAVAAFRRSPVTASALAVVARADDLRGNTAAGDALLEIAARLTKRDPDVNLWRVIAAAGDGNEVRMAQNADIALRTGWAGSREVWNIVLAESDNPAFVDPLAKRLAARPRWRRDYLLALASSPSSGAGTSLVLETLARTAAPPTREELYPYFMQGGRELDPNDLRDQWRRLDRDVDQRAATLPVYDGGFNGLGGVPPFNWVLPQGVDGLNAALVQEPGKGGHLEIRSALPSAQTGARQELLLTPGRYRISVRHWALDGADQVPFTLAIACLNGSVGQNRKLLAKAAPRIDALDVEVPRGCDAQWLYLDTAPTTDGGITAVALDDVSVSRL